MSDEGARFLDRLAQSSMVADGRADLIVSDAIAERFGSRWSTMREAVYDHVECVLSGTADPVGPLSRTPIKAMKGIGLQALSYSCPRGAMDDAEFIEWLRPWLRASKPLTRSLMVYRCSSERQMAIAGSLGATHGSLESMSEDSHPEARKRVSLLVLDSQISLA